MGDQYKTVGERIKGYREARGIKGNAFAGMLEIKPSSLSEIETGKSKKPAALTLLKAAAALGLEPYYLLTGDGPRVRSLSQVRPDEAELLLLFRDLPADLKQELLAEANRLSARSQQETSGAGNVTDISVKEAKRRAPYKFNAPPPPDEQESAGDEDA